MPTNDFGYKKLINQTTLKIKDTKKHRNNPGAEIEKEEKNILCIEYTEKTTIAREKMSTNFIFAAYFFNTLIDKLSRPLNSVEYDFGANMCMK